MDRRNRQTNRDRQRYRQIERQTGETGRQTEIQAGRQTETGLQIV